MPSLKSQSTTLVDWILAYFFSFPIIGAIGIGIYLKEKREDCEIISRKEKGQLVALIIAHVLLSILWFGLGVIFGNLSDV